MPATEEARIVGRQLLRIIIFSWCKLQSGLQSKIQAEFHSKLSIVVEEADESVFWMEILVESEIINQEELNNLMKEANEILKVVSTARKTASVTIINIKPPELTIQSFNPSVIQSLNYACLLRQCCHNPG